MSLHTLFNTQPEIIEFKPGYNATWNNPRNPIEIIFDKPIDPNRVKFNIVPEISGQIKYEKSFDQLPFTRKIYFYPSESLDPENRIYIYVNNFFSIYSNIERYGLEAYIDSYKPPQIIETSLENNATEVPINNIFEFTLDKEVDEFSEFTFEFIPTVEFQQEINGNKISITLKVTLPQSTSYAILAKRSIKKVNLSSNQVISVSTPETIKELKFTTITAPEIKSFGPVGTSVYTDAEIKIETISKTR